MRAVGESNIIIKLILFSFEFKLDSKWKCERTVYRKSLRDKQISFRSLISRYLLKKSLNLLRNHMEVYVNIHKRRCI